MKVSAFTFIRDGIRLDFPFVESIKSILPICDEFVVNVGDSPDETLEIVKGIGEPKIKIINSRWDENLFVKGKINAVETNRALSYCSGDWAFYLQADEIVHEKWLPRILDAMMNNLEDMRIQGLLFHYGSLRNLAKFKGIHPSVMKERIARKFWGVPDSSRINKEHRHNKLSIRFLSWLERNVFHRTVFEGSNYKLAKNKELKTYPFNH